MKKICSMCEADLGTIEGEPPFPGAVSHGFCETCLHHVLAQVGISLEEYLEGLPAPAVAMTPSGRVGRGNRAAMDLLAKSNEAVEGEHGGLLLLTVEPTHQSSDTPA
jgi:hypothetical protein